MFYLCSLLGVLWRHVLYLSLGANLSLFLFIVWGSVLISLIYMQLSSFPNTICWIDCLFCIMYSCLLCQRLIGLGVCRKVLLCLGLRTDVDILLSLFLARHEILDWEWFFFFSQQFVNIAPLLPDICSCQWEVSCLSNGHSCKNLIFTNKFYYFLCIFNFIMIHLSTHLF